MTSNTHKRLDKIEKEITDLGAKGRKFHFILGDANEPAEAKLERMKAEGTVKKGDEVQLVQVPWIVRELKGSSYIPEGSDHDPYADPGLPPEPQATTNWGEQREREQRWKDHVKKIERDGTRFDPDKPKDDTWR